MLNVKPFTFNPFQENTYIIYNEKNNCIIIDPGMYDQRECDTLFNFIDTHQLTVTQIVNTHCHLDHIFGVKATIDKYQCPFTYHPNEQQVMDWAATSSLMWGVTLDMPPNANYHIHENDTVQLDDTAFTVLFTPGHSPGSICLYNTAENLLIAGDLIMQGSFGRTDLPGGNTDDLVRSIQQKVLTLPEATRIYSGHGPDTTVADEKRHNPIANFTA